LPQFVKVMPTDYKRVLQERMAHDEEIEARVQGVEENGDGQPPPGSEGFLASRA
jgi:hypothetical protein